MDQSCTSITSNIQIPESVVHTLQTYEELSLFSVNPTKIPISPLKQISKLYHSNYLDRIRHSMIDFQREIVRGRICKSKIADIYIYIYTLFIYSYQKSEKIRLVHGRQPITFQVTAITITTSSHFTRLSSSCCSTFQTYNHTL